MSGRSPLAAEMARLLRQRLELGAGDLVLDGLDRNEALRLLAAARSLADAAPRAASPPRVAAPSAAAQTDGTIPTPPASRPSAPPVASAAGTPAGDAGASRDLPVLPDDYDGLRDVALRCTLCKLAETRTQVVFSDGAPDARLMVVGEAPGANEDATGLPFVGAAGRFLDLLLACIDLSREESVYIANVLKCRPPGNRNPLPVEIDCCAPYLKKQIELVRPEVLLAVGTFSAQLLTGQTSTLGRLRGTVHSYQGVPLVVTYHPAALLRNPKWTRPVWDDLQLLRGVLDGG